MWKHILVPVQIYTSCHIKIKRVRYQNNILGCGEIITCSWCNTAVWGSTPPSDWWCLKENFWINIFGLAKIRLKRYGTQLYRNG